MKIDRYYQRQKDSLGSIDFSGVHLQIAGWVTHNPDFKGTPLFDVEYLRNNTRHTHGWIQTTDTKWSVAYWIYAVANNLGWPLDVILGAINGFIVCIQQEAQLSLTNRTMLVCKVVEVWQDFLSEYVNKKFTYICYRRLIRHERIYYGSKNCVIYNS